MPEAVAALNSDDQVQVETEPWLIFQPATGEPDTGLIFYPGGRIDPRSYAPAARAIAAQGYLVVIVPMPLNLAVFGVERASEVMEAFPQIEHWVIGGHSLGGAMAATYANRQPQAVEGLVFWAAYPSSSDDLSPSDLKVLSLFGTQDGLTTGDKVDASRALLPPTTSFTPIEGGNHAQFGWYGPQPGDGEATISREAQQKVAVDTTMQLLAGSGTTGTIP
jgi:pimeloyl-ACP methyl ester carboxylesterase